MAKHVFEPIVIINLQPKANLTMPKVFVPPNFPAGAPKPVYSRDCHYSIPLKEHPIKFSYANDVFVNELGWV